MPHARNKAFTLIELSIVVVIIGLIVAGVVAGQSLVKQAQLRTIMSDMQQIQTALQTFYLQYNAIPGDMPNATSYWPGQTDVGNGNKVVHQNANTSGAASETSRVFEQMSLAGIYAGAFLPGNCLATTGGNSVPEMGPEGPRNSRYIVTSYTQLGGFSPINRNQIAGNSVNVIRLGGIFADGVNANTHIANGILTITEVVSIDQKADDGLARSGAVSGHNELLTGQNNSVGCLEFGGPGTSDATGAANYNLGGNALCNISFDTMW